MKRAAVFDDTFNALVSALRFARAQTNPDITVQRLLILLCVYRHEGSNQRELLERLHSTSATALSRNLADLSALNVKKQAGLALIEFQADPMNLRIKRVYLTRKGKQFMRRWAAAMQAPVVSGNRPARDAEARDGRTP